MTDLSPDPEYPAPGSCPLARGGAQSVRRVVPGNFIEGLLAIHRIREEVLDERGRPAPLNGFLALGAHGAAIHFDGILKQDVRVVGVVLRFFWKQRRVMPETPD